MSDSKKKEMVLPYTIKFKGTFGDIDYECEANTKEAVKQAKEDIIHFTKTMINTGDYIRRDKMKERINYWKEKSIAFDKERKMLQSKMKCMKKMRLEEFLREIIRDIAFWEVQEVIKREKKTIEGK